MVARLSPSFCRCHCLLWQWCGDSHAGVSLRAAGGRHWSVLTVHWGPQRPDERVLQLKVHPPWPPWGRQIRGCYTVWGKLDIAWSVAGPAARTLPPLLFSLISLSAADIWRINKILDKLVPNNGWFVACTKAAPFWSLTSCLCEFSFIWIADRIWILNHLSLSLRLY